MMTPVSSVAARAGATRRNPLDSTTSEDACDEQTPTALLSNNNMAATSPEQAPFAVAVSLDPAEPLTVSVSTVESLSAEVLTQKQVFLRYRSSLWPWRHRETLLSYNSPRYVSPSSIDVRVDETDVLEQMQIRIG